MRIVLFFRNYCLGLVRGVKLHPSGIFLDLVTIAGGALFFRPLSESFESVWLGTYLFVFLFFCLTLVLRYWDRSYLQNLARVRETSGWTVAVFVFLLGLVLSGFAFGSLLTVLKRGGVIRPGEILPFTVGAPAVLGVLGVYPAVFGILPYRRSGKGRWRSLRESKFRDRMLKAVCGMGLFGVTLYMEAFVYRTVRGMLAEGVSLPLRFIVLLCAGFLFTAFYLPARIHVWFEAPEDSGGRSWLILTALSLAVFAVSGVSIL